MPITYRGDVKSVSSELREDVWDKFDYGSEASFEFESAGKATV